MFVGAGNAVINDGTVMQGNHAEDGGCICERARVIRSLGSCNREGREEEFAWSDTPDSLQCVCVYLSNWSIN